MGSCVDDKPVCVCFVIVSQDDEMKLKNCYSELPASPCSASLGQIGSIIIIRVSLSNSVGQAGGHVVRLLATCSSEQEIITMIIIH